MTARKATRRELRIWGFVLAAPLALLAWLSRERPVAAPLLAGLAAFFLLGAALAPRILGGPKSFLDPIVARIGWLVTTLALFLFYFLAVTPIGLLRRGRTREAFGLGRESGRPSHWSPRPADAEPMRHMERQYT